MSILLASIFTPAILLLVDIGLSGVDSARWGSFTEDPLGPLAALGTLFLAGLIYGALVMVRLSPVGPGFAGLAMMAISSWAVLDPSSYYETVGRNDARMAGAVGQWGLGMLLGAPLVATLTSPRRWRDREDGRGNHDHANPADLTPALPISETLTDMWLPRPQMHEAHEAHEAPTVPIVLGFAPAATNTPPTQSTQPLPRRIPMVPPVEATAITEPGSSLPETAAALDAAPTRDTDKGEHRREP